MHLLRNYQYVACENVSGLLTVVALVPLADLSQQMSSEVPDLIIAKRGRPPLGQDKAWSTEKEAPQAQ